MRIRHENGCTIIVDVYEPAPCPTPIPLTWRVFLVLGVLACIGGVLAVVVEI
jgi:hypothetical protein